MATESVTSRVDERVTQPFDFQGNERAKIRGETLFTQDLHLPGELAGAILRSPHPHARILRIDATRARTLPGVMAVLTGPDVSQAPYGPTAVKDWNILAGERVLMIGDEVAAVAATSRAEAEVALAAIEVEYEPLPAVFDPEEALREGAPQVHPAISAGNRPLQMAIDSGDVDAALASAYLVRGGRYTTNRIYQSYLEPNAVLADWNAEAGFTLWAPSHIPTRARETYAVALGVPEDQVRIIVPPIGGSFGGKYVLKAHVIAAALARVTGTPVKISLDRTEDMQTAHPRVPLTIDLRIGVDQDGRFVGKDVVVYADSGARVYWSPNVLATACSRVDSLYNFGAVRARGYLVYTNTSPTTCMRGFGNAEMLFAVESVIDELAEGLKMDPAELRLRNIVHAGEVSVHGYQIDTCRLDDCIRQVTKLSDWKARRGTLPPFHGLGIAVANHVSGFRLIDPRYEGSNAVARLLPTGLIEIETGEIDLGQGLSGTYAEIAARALEVDPEQIVVRSGDTARYPYGIGTLASRGTVIGGNAVQMVAFRLREAIAAYVRQVWGVNARVEGAEVVTGEGATVTFAELAVRYGAQYGQGAITAQASYSPSTTLPDAHFYGNPSPSYPFAAHVAEVEVDPETGRVRVVGYWAAHDAGMVLNPVAAHGQVLGAVAQGIGWALMEDLVERSGAVVNPSLLDYRLPGAGDLPPVSVTFVEEVDPHGPFGAKSLAEAAIDPVAAAVANAIAHATGKRGHALPLNPERVWSLLHAGDL